MLHLQFAKFVYLLKVIFKASLEGLSLEICFSSDLMHFFYPTCLGPSKATLNDIWRMTWQLKSTRIIMVSNLTEDGRVSCDDKNIDCVYIAYFLIYRI